MLGELLTHGHIGVSVLDLPDVALSDVEDPEFHESLVDAWLNRARVLGRRGLAARSCWTVDLSCHVWRSSGATPAGRPTG